MTHIHRLQIADDASSLRRVEKFGEHDGRLPARTSLSKSFHRIKHVEFFVNAYDRAFRGLRISHLYTYYRSAFFCSSSYNFLYIIIGKHTHSLSLSLPLSLTHTYTYITREIISSLCDRSIDKTFRHRKVRWANSNFFFRVSTCVCSVHTQISFSILYKDKRLRSASSAFTGRNIWRRRRRRAPQWNLLIMNYLHELARANLVDQFNRPHSERLMYYKFYLSDQQTHFTYVDRTI